MAIDWKNLEIQNDIDNARQKAEDAHRRLTDMRNSYREEQEGNLETIHELRERIEKLEDWKKRVEKRFPSLVEVQQ